MKNKIQNNILLNVFKTFVVAVFPLITYPYVLRVLGAENVGKVNYVSSIISYFSIIAGLGVSNYAVRAGAPLRDRPDERNAFFNEVFTINFATMAFAYVALAVVCVVFSYLHSYYLLFIIQSLAFAFAWIGCEWIFSIYEDYLAITVRTLVAHLLSLVALFLFVRNCDDYVAYSLVNVLALGASYLLNYLLVKKYYRPKLTTKPNFKKHFLPMLILGANSLAIIVYVSADTTMIGTMMGDYSVGLYSTGVKIYNLLKQVMGAVIAASTARMAYYYNEDDVKYEDLFNKMFKIILIFCVPVAVGLSMASIDVLFLFAGSEYLGGLGSLRILSFAIPFASIGSLLGTYGLIIQKKERVFLMITICSAALNIVLNIFFIPWFGIGGAAITTLISEAFVCIAFFIATRRYKLLLGNIRIIVFVLIGAITISGICFFTYKLIDAMILRLSMSVIVSVISYALILLLSKDEMIYKELHKLFNRRDS